MDSYATDVISSAKEISMHGSVTICAVVRVVYIHNFTLDFVLMLIIIFCFSENYNKHLVRYSVFSTTNGHHICAHTAE